ncbi:MAG: hypothetical protein Q9170_005863 [Blastenia crenularia]
MRLIDTSTLTLRNFYDAQTPPYAILSHTWGSEEVTFQVFEMPRSKKLKGYAKINSCCALARSDGWEYIWVDTCCIDKSSSAELSEAINSMYRWYQKAQVCYAYMVDVDGHDISTFANSRWFTRGWTLQELLAPEMVVFYDLNWEELGTKLSLEEEISAATGISSQHLSHRIYASVAARMSWAAQRGTTRVEDIAYCLMGLFDVNMPLLYGEGGKAFTRLQEAILSQNSDESIFAWRGTMSDPNRSSGLFALSPSRFKGCGDVVSKKFSQLSRRPIRLTNQGLKIDLHWVIPEDSTDRLYHCGISKRLANGDEAIQVLLLNAVQERSEECPIIVPLVRGMATESLFRKAKPFLLFQDLGEFKGPIDVSQAYIVATYDNARPKEPRLILGQLTNLLIALAHLGPSFSLVGKDSYGFTTLESDNLSVRDDLGGLEIRLRYGPMQRTLLQFQNHRGETFIMEVYRSDVRNGDECPTFRVFVPNFWVLNKDVMVEFFGSSFLGPTSGTHRASCSLQHNSKVSISIRKKSFGKKEPICYWVLSIQDGNEKP